MYDIAGTACKGMPEMHENGRKGFKNIQPINTRQSFSSIPRAGVENRTAFLRGRMSDVLVRGDDAGDPITDDGAETHRAPGKNRDMRIFKDVSERFDCGVEGQLDVTVVEEAVDRPGLADDTVEPGFFREERAGGGGSTTDGAVRREVSFWAW